jgi:putative ABC transport system permease protein
MVVVAVLSVRVSMDATLDEALSYWQFDVQLQFMQPYRIRRIEYEAAQVPGVATTECWGSATTYRVRPDGSTSESFGVTAVPADTEMLDPQLVAGRWLEADDERGLVINSFLWSLEPDIAMGDVVTLKLEGRESTWQVVGVVKTTGNVASAYADYDAVAEEVREVGLASSVQVKLEEEGEEGSDAARQEAVAKSLETRFEAAGMDVASKLTSTQQRAQSGILFNIIVTQLLIMAALMAVVGGLGLMGTMSLNVLERTREIGVMRAVGASNDALMQIVLTEGLLIGVLSWGFGVLLAWPFGAILSRIVGLRFLNAPLTYVYSFSGALIWLGAVVVLAGAATYLPAQRAVRLRVRETLSYE